jgi:ComF family protein
MIPAAGPRCDICWMPIEPSRQCRRCRSHRTAFDGARAAFVYEGAARDAVLALKFRGVSAVAAEMGRSMAATLAEWRPDADSILPVPLSGQRRRLRGYNQSQLLAKELSHLTGLPLESRALTRRRHTHPQTTLTGDARWQNVWESFRPGKAVPSGGIILIDDVITTGATLDACARVLLTEGAEAVFALTFARED